MKTIVVLLDTLNRRSIPAYGGSGVYMPNIDRFAERSILFDQHWSGSLPCMPARRDIMTGRMSFLEKGWGAIEPFDHTLPAALRKAGVFSHMVTDHYHYFATGGENYCQAFDTWDFHRGQEDDPWTSKITAPEKPDEYYGRIVEQCERNRQRFNREEDYPGPRTLTAACDWLELNKDEDDYFLMVEAFDPHEPFDCPQHYLDMYQDSYTGPHFDWPVYGGVDVPDEALKHLRNRYAANLTMIDVWFGKFLDTMDRNDLWKDTLVIFTTDHGFLLGEHQQLGKNIMHVYNELAHIPLMISLPGGQGAGTRIEALTQNIDLMPTILDYMGVEAPQSVKGNSLKKLMERQVEKVREVAMFGYHGMAVNVTDGEYTYMRAPKSLDNDPCYSYTAMPTTFRSYIGINDAALIEAGRYLPRTDFPVFRIPLSRKGEPFSGTRQVRESLLFNIKQDYAQQYPIHDEAVKQRMTQLLRECMSKADAPLEQYSRLGLEQG
jgi:arylsulfatase A-like enzyme